MFSSTHTVYISYNYFQREDNSAFVFYREEEANTYKNLMGDEYKITSCIISSPWTNIFLCIFDSYQKIKCFSTRESAEEYLNLNNNENGVVYQTYVKVLDMLM